MCVSSYFSSLFQFWGVWTQSQPPLHVLTVEFQYFLIADFGLELFNWFWSILSLTHFSPVFFFFFLILRIRRCFYSKIISYLFDLLNVIFVSVFLIVRVHMFSWCLYCHRLYNYLHCCTFRVFMVTKLPGVVMLCKRMVI